MRMVNFVLALFIGISLSPSSSVSAQQPSAVVEDGIPTYRFKSVMRSDGRIDIVPDDAAPGVASPSPVGGSTDTAVPETILRNQEWYVKVDSAGRTEGLYTVPLGTTLNADVFTGLEAGGAVMKVEPSSSYFQVFPTAAQIEEQLSAFIETARVRVCGFTVRPTRFLTSIDVSPGWGAAGTIKFEAEWTSQELCGEG